MAENRSLAGLMAEISFEDFLDLFGVIEDAKTRIVSRLELWDAQRQFANWLDGEWSEGINLKARQLGISTLTGLYAIYTALKTPGAQVLVISKDDKAAKYYLNYKVANVYKRLPKFPGIVWPQIRKDSTEEFMLSNGSLIASLAATGSGSAGYVATLALVDEAGLIDANSASKGGLAEVVINIRATVEKSGGKLVYFGTSKRGSYFTKLVEKKLRGEMPDVEFFFLPSSSDPNRTAEDMARLRQSSPSEADFLSQYPEKPEDVLMSRAGLVFPMFEPQEGNGHVFKDMAVDKDLPTYFILDHGYAHPTVLLWAAYDISCDMLYILGERRWEKTSVPEIAKDIHVIKNKLPKIPEIWLADAAIFNETGVTSVANVYRQHGIQWRRSFKHKGLDIVDGSLGMLASRFIRNLVQISSRCKGLIWELANWEWDIRRDGSDKNKPVDVADDGIDCMPKGTMILMADGSNKCISEVEAGEYVQTASGSMKVVISGATGVKKLWMVRTAKGSFKATAGHQVFTTKGWKRVDELTKDMYLIATEDTSCQKQKSQPTMISLGNLPLWVQTVNNVVRNIVKRHTTPYFAPISAKLSIGDYQELMTRHEGVQYAKKTIAQIDTQKLELVATPVLECYATGEDQETYNLTIPACPEYFANGHLVHNCLRYLCAEVARGVQDAEMTIPDDAKTWRYVNDSHKRGTYGSIKAVEDNSFDRQDVWMIM